MRLPVSRAPGTVPIRRLVMDLFGLRRFWEQRRYRDVSLLRGARGLHTEASLVERVLRAIRRRERFGYDETEVRAQSLVRVVLLVLFVIFGGWFALKSLLVIGIFN